MAPAFLVFVSCGSFPTPWLPSSSAPTQEEPVLSVMSLIDEINASFETKVLGAFATQHGLRLQYLPAFESDNDRLQIYNDLLHRHSPAPDLLEIDVIWPPTLSEGLLDLTPYLGDLAAYPPELMQAFTVRGRVVGVPVFVDTGLLYYRSDLLRKYGFRAPPKTWDELERMARVIQSGERLSGKKNFWGFVWQGEAGEALTCNALEWFASQGGGHILEPDQTIRVYSPNAVHALARAVSWINTISPPGVVAYSEDDSLNVWRSGNAAFMRSWVYLYGTVRDRSCPLRDRFGVATVPGGSQGNRRALGGIAIAVSQYSQHKEQAIAALRCLTSAATQSLRAKEIGSMPTRSLLQQEPDLMVDTPFHGPLAGQVMTGVITRPSVLAGKSYDDVSRAFFESVHAALTREMSPSDALLQLESKLVRITGFRPVHSVDE